MSRKGLIFDRLKPAWDALTAEQRICWHVTAGDNPSLNLAGELRTENGWQYFVDVNSALAVVDESLILSDPPTTDDNPEPVAVTVATWPLPAKPATGPSVRRHAPVLTFPVAIPLTVALVVTQTYDKFGRAHNRITVSPRITLIRGETQTWLTTDDTTEYITLEDYFLPESKHTVANNAPRVRHVQVAQPGATGPVPLSSSSGYFATTAGANRFGKILGYTATRRPDLPLGRIRVINLANGKITRQTIPNPTGSS